MPPAPDSFPNAPPTERFAVIVSHGSPSDPAPQEELMQALAATVAPLVPGWQVEGVTLAAPGRFEAVLERGETSGETPVVYPFFMARGWFTETHLINRIGARAAHVLAPTGTDPALPTLVSRLLNDTLARNGWHAAETALLLAAHGSRTHPDSAESARVITQMLDHVMGFRATVTGFIEQEPFLTDTARDLGQAICLPFFAMNAGHMLTDLPEALSMAQFSGPVLPALIDAPGLPALIADSLRRHANERPAA